MAVAEAEAGLAAAGAWTGAGGGGGALVAAAVALAAARVTAKGIDLVAASGASHLVLFRGTSSCPSSSCLVLFAAAAAVWPVPQTMDVHCVEKSKN